MLRKLFCLVSFAVLLCAVSSAHAAVLEITPDAPVPGELDIANFVGALTDADNVGTEDDSNNPPYWNDWCTYVAHDRGGQGQTFLTGDEDALVTGVWVKHVTYSGANPDQTWYRMQPGAELEIRITDPAAAGTDAFVLSSEIYVVTGEEENALPADTTNDQTGTSLWFHITLDAPVALAASTLYGFDLTSLSGKAGIMFFETDGINDRAEGGNPYEAGTAYTSGVNPDDHGDDLNGANDNNMVIAPGDHVFVVELEAAAAPGPTIAWVSYHAADDEPHADAAAVGFTQAPDIGYTDLLKANGYNVVRVLTSQTPDVEYLNTMDLVIISRTASSGHYSGSGATLWNSVTAPMINLNGYTLRSSRLGFTDGTDMPDTTGDVRLAVTDPTHPIFAGISITDGVMDNLYAAGAVPLPTDGTPSRGISINNNTPDNDGIVLATIAEVSADTGPVGGMVIAEWPAGAVMENSSGSPDDVLGGPRLVFLTGSREPSGVTGGQAAALYDLYPDGEKMFLNAVKYMIPVVPVDPGTEGLVAHYAFENDLTDSSGNGLDGTAIGDPVFVAGVEGMALDFNGDDYVDCGGAAEFSFTDEMTVSTWVNIRSVTTAWMAMIAKGENAWRLGVNNTTSGVHYAFSGGGRGWQAANTATELAFDEWYHVAATYDTSAGALVYIDGVVDASNPDLGGIDTNAFSLLLGENPEATGRYLDGMLDEIKIYDRALSEAEVLYLAGLEEKENLVQNPSFEEDEAILDDPDWLQWCTWNPAEGAGSNATIVDTDAADGTRSLLIEPVGPENWHFIVLYLPIPTEVGASYTASFWAKAMDSRPLGVQFKATDNTVSWGYTDFQLTTEWAEYSLTADAKNAETKLEFFCAGVEVALLLDAVSVYKVADAPAEPQVTNLALNPSFEEDEVVLDDPTWTAWCTWNPAEGAGSNATIVDTEAVDGARSLRVEPIGVENWHFIVANISFPLELGADFTITFWAKAEAQRPLTASFKAADNSVSWGFADFELTTEWAEYSLTSTAESDAGKIEFLCAGNEVPFWIDNVSAYKAE